MKLRNYEQKTIDTYINYLKQYATFCSKNKLNPKEDAKTYILYLIQNKKSISTQNQAINAIKYYWEHILGKERKRIDIERPM
ncbi:MAG: phage integrase N-terminal SAM-like domain-containing protein, partial [Chitinophagales bacterium]